MSNLWSNIRFGRLFFQSSPDKWFCLKKAVVSAKYPGWLGVYCLFGHHLRWEAL